jgi:uncharacterized membrane protein HdeD (DUF308 family)
MLLGHYSASFALKSMTRDVRLWVLIIAVQLMDVFWTSLLLLNVEKASVDPALASVPLDLYYMPYSHSLVSLLIVCVAVFFLYRSLVPPKGLLKPALIVALAVMSHWILDIFVHRPDLPLYDDTDKIGLGLWNYPVWALLLEAGLLFVGIFMYLRSTTATSKGGKYGMVVFGLVLVAIQVGVVFGPVPGWLTIQVVAVSLLAYYFAAAAVVMWLEKKRE